MIGRFLFKESYKLAQAARRENVQMVRTAVPVTLTGNELREQSERDLVGSYREHLKASGPSYKSDNQLEYVHAVYQRQWRQRVDTRAHTDNAVEESVVPVKRAPK